MERPWANGLQRAILAHEMFGENLPAWIIIILSPENGIQHGVFSMGTGCSSHR